VRCGASSLTCFIVAFFCFLGLSLANDNAPSTQFGEACTVSQIFTQRDFNNLFPNANGAANQAKPNQYPIYSYKNLLEAAQTFPTFSCTGNVETRKRELVAFLAQTSQQTSNWWDGEPYIWGYFYSTEKWIEGDYCNSTNTEFPCVLGKKYDKVKR